MLALLAALVTSGVILGLQLNKGWFPHDEGALGQAAERVLRGEVPHRDFDEIYTGLLTYLNALTFKLGGHSSAMMRVPLFVVSVAWVAALFQIARRFVPAFGAALVTVTVFVWSVPNYPAPLPSWFNLFLATFGSLALLRAVETGRMRWLVTAGALGGVSFLFKLSGLFFVLGGVIALIAASPPLSQARDGGSRRSLGGIASVSIPLLAIIVVLGRATSSAGVAGLARFVGPIGVFTAALIVREVRQSGGTGVQRWRALVLAIGPFALGAAIPIAVYGAYLWFAGALPATIDGVLVTPFRREAFASVRPPGPELLISSFVLGLLLVPRAPGRVARAAAVVGASGLCLVLIGSADRPGMYRVGWLSAWGLPLVAAVGAAALMIHVGPGSMNQRTRGAVMLAAVALSVLLVEYPFAEPIYTLYAIPVTMLALVAIVRAGGRTPVALQVIVVVFLLAFGVARINPAPVAAFGHGFVRSEEVVRLDLPRSGILVTRADAAEYEELIEVVEELSEGRILWAGPDAPEVYFLSGVPNRTRTMFDFLDATKSPGDIIGRVHAAEASLVVLNLNPSFSLAPSAATIAQLRSEFRHTRDVAGWRLYWR